MTERAAIVLFAVLAAIGGYPLIRTMQALHHSDGFTRRLLLGFVLQTTIVTITLLSWALLAFAFPAPRPPLFRTAFWALFAGQYVLLVIVNWWVYRTLLGE